ncbi:NADAR family protein [Flavobacterium cerinum]|uniref:NADAR family protein n=1 Tax=Flavobacterium cerinum TaxID=2502784 RepID=A0A3S3RFL1_9FLAO|nr:NADAR family protein [Flavobacterium cerinum]RWW93845.1 NADAR family protein [Flavobacterium cerinum]
MKYTVENLVNDGHPKEYIFFWGHQSSKDDSITKSCFSQWWESAFEVNGINYKSAEHWMMAKKAVLFDDTETAARILECNSPAETKKLGREVKNYVDLVWLEHRYKIVLEGNYHKFNQNEELKTFLLGTQHSVIVEASPVDAIWGIGMAADDVRVNDPEKWRGLNLLGFALMEVRDIIKENRSI